MMKFLRQERTCWIVNLIGNVLFFLVSAAYQISVEIPVYTCVLMQACMLILELFIYRDVPLNIILEDLKYEPDNNEELISKMK